MTRTELIKLHDHLVAHYNAHGAEEAREQISMLEELLVASIARNPSPPPMVESEIYLGRMNMETVRSGITTLPPC